MKFIFKWLINGVIVSSLLVFYTDINYITAAFIASALSVIDYFIGDQLLLRATNNTVATIADGLGTLLFLGIVADSMNFDLSFGESGMFQFRSRAIAALSHQLSGEPKGSVNPSISRTSFAASHNMVVCKP